MCITLSSLQEKKNSLIARRAKFQAQLSLCSWDDFSGPPVPYQQNERLEHGLFTFFTCKITQPVFTKPL